MKKKGTAYIKMVCSFVAVFCLALCMIVLFYLYSSDVMEKQAEYSNKNLLSTVQSVCDQDFIFYENMLRSHAYDEFVEELGEMTVIDSSKYEDLKDLVTRMRTSLSFMDSFDSADQQLLIYFPKIDRICSAKYGLTMTSAYADEVFLGKQEPLDILLEKMSIDSLFSVSVLQDLHMGKDMMLMTRTCWNRNDNCDATVGILVDLDKLASRLSTIEWEHGCNWLILDENNYVLKGAKDVADHGTYLDLEQLSDNGYFVNQVKSDFYGWKYILLTPETMVKTSVDQIRIFFSVVLLVFLSLGLVLIRKLSIMNYAPLQTLIEKFPAKRDTMDSKKEEYAFLQEEITSLMTASADMKRKITHNNNSIKKKELIDLLVMPFDRHTMPNNDHLSELDHGENMVLLIKDKLWQTEDDTEESNNLKMFIIDNVFNEKVGEKFLCRMAELDGRQVLVVHDPDMSARKEVLWEIAEDLQQIVLEHFDLCITLAAGGIHDNLAGIHESYLEALEAEEFVSILEQDSIDYDDVRDNMLHKYDYSMQAEERIVSAIRNNNAELAIAFIDRILKINFSENITSSNMRQCLLQELYCTLLKAADEKGCIEKINVSHSGFNIKCPLEELQEKYAKLVQQLCASDDLQSNCGTNKELCQKVLNYVQENYDSYELNISQAAQHFCMTPSGLSAIYKKETGKSLLKEINNIRIEKAIEFLNAGYSVVETAEKVGISESSSFIRLFKKYVGVTPGQMKNQLQEGKEVHWKRSDTQDD